MIGTFEGQLIEEQFNSIQTKTPSDLHRDGVQATVWLPLASWAQYFITL
jgi:hypothetical protein